MRVIIISLCGDTCPYYEEPYSPHMKPYCGYTGAEIPENMEEDFPITCHLDEI